MSKFEALFTSDIFKALNSRNLGYFEVSDFVKISQLSQKLYQVVIDKKIIKKVVQYGCLDNKLRQNFWRKLCQYEELEDALREQLGIEDDQVNIYEHIHELISYELTTQDMPESSRKVTSKVVEEISKDLKRTHTSELMKT